MNELKRFVKIEKFVEKNLCLLDSFHLIDDYQETGLNIELKKGERMIGIYHNHPNNENLVVVTDLGLYLESNGEWKYLDYMLMRGIGFSEDIVRNVKGLNRKINPKKLIIAIEGGPDFALPIINECKSGGWDVLSFHGFIRKILFWVYKIKNLRR